MGRERREGGREGWRLLIPSFQETRRGPEIHGSYSSMEHWDAVLSPATTHFPAERSSFVSLQLRDRPFDSFQSEFLSPFNFTTHEMEVPFLINLLMGLFRGAVFHHGGGARKQPIEQPTEMPTSTMALMGRFPSFMGRFPTLMGRFPDFAVRGRFTS